MFILLFNKTVKNSSYSVSLYGKATRINVPTVNGTYDDGTGSASDTNDGKVISMKAKDSTGAYTIDCGETTTVSQTTGTSSSQTHGNFSGLGNGNYWIDKTYTDKYSTIDVKFFVDGVATTVEKTLRTDTASYNVKLE